MKTIQLTDEAYDTIVSSLSFSAAETATYIEYCNAQKHNILDEEEWDELKTKAADLNAAVEQLLAVNPLMGTIRNIRTLLVEAYGTASAFNMLKIDHPDRDELIAARETGLMLHLKLHNIIVEFNKLLTP